MTAANMAAHAVFLGGLEHVWHPAASDVPADVALQRLFAKAKVTACSFDGSECEYTHAHALLSPATMVPPCRLAAVTGSVAEHLRNAMRVLDTLLVTRADTTVCEVFACQQDRCALAPAHADE
jgi:hypothetical protein